MKVFAVSVLCLAIAVTLVHCTISKEHQQAIEKILENAGDQTVTAIFAEIDQVVKTMGSQAEADHKKWKTDIKNENNGRELAMKEAMKDLTPEAYNKLVRIILVQQNPILTQNEKKELLRKIKYNMDDQVKKELLSKLSDDILFHTIL